MSKHSSDRLIIKYIIKVLISTLVSITGISLLFSFIIYKFDLPLDYNNVISVIIAAICSSLITTISVYGLKNNGVLMGVISQIPLIFYSLFNLIFNENTLLFFIIKTVVCISIGALTGHYITKRKKRYKI